MSKNIGTLVIDSVRPYDSVNTFAVAYNNELKGGLHIVQTDASRNAIFPSRLDDGMLVYVLDSTEGGNNRVMYQYHSTADPSWEVFNPAGVTFEYIDGSLAERDLRLDSIDASIERIDSSLNETVDLVEILNASLNNYVLKAGDTMTGPLTISAGGLDVTGDTSLHGSLFVDDNTYIGGNLTINGSLYVIDVAAIDVSASFIHLNSGLTGPTPAYLQSGIVVERGDSDPYIFVYDEDNQTFRIGVTYLETSTHYSDASTQAVATREDSPVPLGIAFWNSDLFRFDTSVGFTLVSYREAQAAQDASILLRLKEASLGPEFSWVGGLLDVSISTIDTSRYTSALANGIVTDGTLGGIPDGTDVSTLKGKTYDELWDMLLFPTTLAYVQTARSLGYTGLSSAYAEPSASYTPTLTATYNPGLIYNGNATPGPNLTGDAYHYVFKLPGGAVELSEAYAGNSRARVYTTPVLVGNAGATHTWSVDVSYNAGSGAYYDNKGNPGTNLYAQRVAATISANSGTITSRNKRYYGTDTNSSLTSSQVMALDVSAFDTSFVLGPVTLNPSNEYVYFCWPSSFSGTPTFWLNSLQITAINNIGPLSFTNSYGHTENYNIYRTDTVQTGTGQSWEVKSS